MVHYPNSANVAASGVSTRGCCGSVGLSGIRKYNQNELLLIYQSIMIDCDYCD
jgi:hypothetical protein